MNPDEDSDAEREVIQQIAHLHRTTVHWLGGVILLAVSGIILIAFLDSSLLDYFGPGEADRTEGTGILASRGSQTDQAVAILGNIASAGIGGLVGWITRDFTIRYKNLKLKSPDKEEN